MMLQHFKFPHLFLRKSKNAYVSFVTPELIDFIVKVKTQSYIRINGYKNRQSRLAHANKTAKKDFRNKVEKRFASRNS